MANAEQQPLIGIQKKLQETKRTRKLRRLKYSCEEIYERMENGLCIFCEEQDTPGHYELKHKRSQIIMIECEDDQLSDDNESIKLVAETDSSIRQFVEPLECVPFLQDLVDLKQEGDHAKTVVEEKLNLPLGNFVEQVVGLHEASCESGTSETPVTNQTKLADTNHEIHAKRSYHKARKKNDRVCELEFDRNISSDKEEFVCFLESREPRLARESLLMNFGIFINPKLLHDKLNARALLVETVGTEEKQSNILSRANHVWKLGGLQVFMRECDDDQVSEDKEAAHQETVKNSAPSVETVTNLEPFVESLKNSVDSQVTKVERFSLQSTSVNGKNIEHQVFDQISLRVTSKEKQKKYLKGWKFKFKNKNLIGVMPQIGQYIIHQPPPFRLRFDTRSFTDVIMPIMHRNTTEKKQHIGLSLSERVWKPGELLCVKAQRDGRESVHSGGSVRKITQQFHGMRLQEIITMDMKFREVIANDVLRELLDVLTVYEVTEIFEKLTKSWKFKFKSKYEKSQLLGDKFLFAKKSWVGAATGREESQMGLLLSCDALLISQEVVAVMCNDTFKFILFMLILMWEFSHSVDSWSFIWIDFKELCAARFKTEREAIKESSKGLSKLEKDHKTLSPEDIGVRILYQFREGGLIEFNGHHTHLKKLLAVVKALHQRVLEVLNKRIVAGKYLKHMSLQKSEILVFMFLGQILDIEQTCGLIKNQGWQAIHEWSPSLLVLQAVKDCKNIYYVTSIVILQVKRGSKLRGKLKLLSPKNHKLLHPEAKLWTTYNNVERINNILQSLSGLNLLACLIAISNQALKCDCEAGYISSGAPYVADGVDGFLASAIAFTVRQSCLFFKMEADCFEVLLNGGYKIDHTNSGTFSVGDAHEFFICSKLQILYETQGKRLLVLKLLVLIQWKENPPDQVPKFAKLSITTSQHIILEDKDLLNRGEL